MAGKTAKKSRHLDISLNELEVFLEVAKTGSIRETARRFHSEPGQVSRLIKRLEGKMGSRLINRSPTGVALTQQGTSAVETASAIIRSADELASLARDDEDEKHRIYGIGATSFLSARLLSPVAGRFLAPEHGFRLRLLDIVPNQMIPYALKGAYDLALHIGELDWPRSWQSQLIGPMRWQLFAGPGVDLHARCSVQAVKEFPFVLPVYWTSEGLVEGNDQCPLRPSQRRAGVATSSAETALGVLKASTQVAFLPEILARDAVKAGELRSIQVKEWKPVVRQVYLTVRTDIVPQKLFSTLTSGLREVL